MRVIVTTGIDGMRFLGPDLKAFDVQSGDVVTVAGEGYGQSLIELGYAALADDEPDMAVKPTIPIPTPPSVNDLIAELVEVDGIGQATAKKLVTAGILSVAALIDADPIALAQALDVTETKVKSWQAAANQLLEEE